MIVCSGTQCSLFSLPLSLFLAPIHKAHSRNLLCVLVNVFGVFVVVTSICISCGSQEA